MCAYDFFATCIQNRPNKRSRRSTSLEDVMELLGEDAELLGEDAEVGGIVFDNIEGFLPPDSVGAAGYSK